MKNLTGGVRFFRRDPPNKQSRGRGAGKLSILGGVCDLVWVQTRQRTELLSSDFLNGPRNFLSKQTNQSVHFNEFHLPLKKWDTWKAH